jgi:alpha-amylase
MGEWALPPDESVGFAEVLHRAQAEGLPEARWLRGAFWRNFQVRYREINDMHKQMLRTSDAVDAMPEGDDRARALDHLYQGQSNDTYWHGLFGGIYISHMRLATYEHLIAAADIAETTAGSLHLAEKRDLDLDGHDEVRLAGPGQVVSIDMDEGGAIGGWDLRAVRHNACAVLRRRPEAYHQKLRDHEAAEAASAASAEKGDRGEGDAAAAGAAADAPTSIHEMFMVKEPGLAAMLHYDPYERRSGLVRFLAPGTTPEAWAAAEAVELGDAIDGAYEIETLELDTLVVGRDATVSTGAGGAGAPVRIVKTFSLGGDRRSPTLTETVEVTNHSDATVDAILGLEWTLTMLGGGGNPAAWLEIDGERTSHDSRRTASAQNGLAQGNDYIGLEIITDVSPAAEIWCAPVETISNSEAGFERVYQGEGLLLGWPVSLAPGAAQTVTVRHAVATSRDHADEERAMTAEPSIS